MKIARPIEYLLPSRPILAGISICRAPSRACDMAIGSMGRTIRTMGSVFNPAKLLVDPYAKSIDGFPPLGRRVVWLYGWSSGQRLEARRSRQRAVRSEECGCRSKEAILDPGRPLNLPVILLARRYRQSGGPGPPLGRKRGDKQAFLTVPRFGPGRYQSCLTRFEAAVPSVFRDVDHRGNHVVGRTLTHWLASELHVGGRQRAGPPYDTPNCRLRAMRRIPDRAGDRRDCADPVQPASSRDRTEQTAADGNRNRACPAGGRATSSRSTSSRPT